MLNSLFTTEKDFFNDFIYLSLERGEGREKERERELAASQSPPTGDVACNPDVCPDRESNLQPFGLQAGIQSLGTPARAENDFYKVFRTGRFSEVYVD